MSKQDLPSKTLLEDAITSEDLLGKDVLDKDGVLVGVSNKLYIDPESIEVLGISIDKGFLRSGLLVGAEHIEQVTPHAVFLKIRPAFRLKGMHVFDLDGARVGAVTAVTLTDDYADISSLQVKPSRFSKPVEIPGSAIGSVEDNVLLRVRREEIF